MFDREKKPFLRGLIYMTDELDRELPGEWGFERIALEKPKPEKAGRQETGEGGKIAYIIRRELAARGRAASECLLLAATDEVIRAARQLNIAAAGFVSPAFPGQTYEGVEMLIEGFEEVDGEFLRRIFERHHWIPWTIAVTERCLVREFAMEDLNALMELYDQPGITYRYDGRGERVPGYIEPLFPLEKECEYQENYIREIYRCFGYGMWLVIDRFSGALIGRAGIEGREYPEGAELELGYLIHPRWQRRGIATEVCTAILDYARDYLGAERMNLLVDADNTASIALAGKLGFSYLEETDVSGSLKQRYMCTLS